MKCNIAQVIFRCLFYASQLAEEPGNRPLQRADTASALLTLVRLFVCKQLILGTSAVFLPAAHQHRPSPRV